MVGVRSVGVPIRRGFVATPYQPRDGEVSFLVLGGSQGAAVLNERGPDAIARVAASGVSVRVVHQTGKGRDTEVSARYGALGLGASARVAPFVDDVAGAIAAADVVVARSGASTLAEIAAVGRPAVFVPYPFAADDHQRRNAEAMAQAGGAICLGQPEASVERLAAELGALAADAAARSRMARAAAALGRPDAAREVARDLVALAGIAPRAWRAPTGVAEVRHV